MPFASSRTYDPASNVLNVSTTLAVATDNQAFYYDEQNRLTWASTSGGAPPCGGQIPFGTLNAAYGPSAFAYDTADRLTSSPTGMSVYDPHHVHAVDSIGSSYSAAYDAAGNMTCRAPSSSSLCVGGSNGQLLSYDNEGRTTGWQNTPTNPTSTEQMAYDGEGHRVALQVNGGTPTYYLGSLEEVSGSTLTKYLSSGLAGVPVAERVGTNGPLSYLVSDGLGSLSEVLSSSGTITDEQLYTPYGSQRYSSGAPPTSYGFTGQRADGASGLDYYNARYYDPVARQFASADTANDGLNRYGYVHANPETLSDPSGQSVRTCGVDSDMCTGAGGVTDGIDKTTDGGSGLGVNGGGQGPGCTANCNGGCTSNCGGTPPGGTPPIRACAQPGAHPTCDEIDNAKANARLAAITFQSFDGLNRFAKGAFAALVAALTFFTRVKPWWLGFVPGALWTALGALAAATFAAAITVVVAFEVAGAVFNWESTQPDSFWQEPSGLQSLYTNVELAGESLAIALAVFSAAVIVLLTNPISLTAGVLAGVAVGAIASAVVIIPQMLDTIRTQQALLGYA